MYGFFCATFVVWIQSIKRLRCDTCEEIHKACVLRAPVVAYESCYRVRGCCVPCGLLAKLRHVEARSTCLMTRPQRRHAGVLSYPPPALDPFTFKKRWGLSSHEGVESVRRLWRVSRCFFSPVRECSTPTTPWHLRYTVWHRTGALPKQPSIRSELACTPYLFGTSVAFFFSRRTKYTVLRRCCAVYAVHSSEKNQLPPYQDHRTTVQLLVGRRFLRAGGASSCSVCVRSKPLGAGL